MAKRKTKSKSKAAPVSIDPVIVQRERNFKIFLGIIGILLIAGIIVGGLEAGGIINIYETEKEKKEREDLENRRKNDENASPCDKCGDKQTCYSEKYCVNNVGEFKNKPNEVLGNLARSFTFDQTYYQVFFWAGTAVVGFFSLGFLFKLPWTKNKIRAFFLFLFMGGFVAALVYIPLFVIVANRRSFENNPEEYVPISGVTVIFFCILQFLTVAIGFAASGYMLNSKKKPGSAEHAATPIQERIDEDVNELFTSPFQKAVNEVTETAIAAAGVVEKTEAEAKKEAAAIRFQALFRGSRVRAALNDDDNSTTISSINWGSEGDSRRSSISSFRTAGGASDYSFISGT